MPEPGTGRAGTSIRRRSPSTPVRSASSPGTPPARRCSKRTKSGRALVRPAGRVASWRGGGCLEAGDGRHPCAAVPISGCEPSQLPMACITALSKWPGSTRRCPALPRNSRTFASAGPITPLTEIGDQLLRRDVVVGRQDPGVPLPHGVLAFPRQKDRLNRNDRVRNHGRQLVWNAARVC
jgi:hypothetical protein